MPYYDEVEWELLQKEQLFESPLWNFEFPFKVPKIKKISIKRDENYNIQVKISFEFDIHFSEKVSNEGIIDSIKIVSDFFSEEYILKNVIILNSVSKHHINSRGSTSLLLSPSFIYYNRLCDKDTSWIKEWYLNGPKEEVMFNRRIKYKKSEFIEKEFIDYPQDFKLGNIFSIESNQKSSGGKYMFCKLNDDDNIIITTVPKKMNPEWSNNICIIYASEDYILNKDLRKDFENIISFLFGRKLIKIGESYYDSKGHKIKEHIINPFLRDKFNIKNICMDSDNFPIHYEYFDSKNEQLISDMITSFLFLKESLDFSTMFINYWNSTFLLPESKMILLSASLESIKKSWLKKKKFKGETTFIDKQLFKTLVRDIKKQFHKRFKEYPKLIGKFDDLNNRGNKKNLELFFKEINLGIGEVEKEVLEYRNRPVHGDNIFSEKYIDMILYSEIYHIILNRVILILLGYEGNYRINNQIQSCVYNKIPYSIKELKEDIYQFKQYSIEE